MKVSKELVEAMTDYILDHLIDEYGNSFSDAIYMVEESDLREELLSLDDDYEQLSVAVKNEVGKWFRSK